jgi:FkbM family methyltransferase
MIKTPNDLVFSNPSIKKDKIDNLGKAEFQIMKPHIKKFRTCLDIGANIGITTIRFAKHFKEVHSFEPLTHDFLVENTKKLSNVHTHKCAVSDKNDTVIEIYPNPNNYMLGIIPDEYNKRFIDKRYTGEHARFKGVKPISVDCITIDALNFKDVDLIKIDVEGHILPVVNGMIETLKNNSPVIQIEMFDVPDFTEMNQKVHDIFQNLGYDIIDTYSKGLQRDRFYSKG